MIARKENKILVASHITATNPHDARLCLRQLKQAGFEAVADVVSTPEEFTEKLHSNLYDPVLADYCIPGGSGNYVPACQAAPAGATFSEPGLGKSVFH